MKRLGFSRGVTTVLSLLLMLCICPALVGCVPRGDVLAYQSEAMHLRVAYEIGATPIEADLVLGAGDGTRDMSLTILSPAEAAGVTFTREAGHFTAASGDTTLPIPGLDTALAPLSMFSVPADATVANVTRAEDGTRTITLALDDVVWTLSLPHGAQIPSRITRTAGGRYFTLAVLEILPL